MKYSLNHVHSKSIPLFKDLLPYVYHIPASDGDHDALVLIVARKAANFVLPIRPEGVVDADIDVDAGTFDGAEFFQKQFEDNRMVVEDNDPPVYAPLPDEVLFVDDKYIRDAFEGTEYMFRLISETGWENFQRSVFDVPDEHIPVWKDTTATIMPEGYLDFSIVNFRNVLRQDYTVDLSRYKVPAGKYNCDPGQTLFYLMEQ